MTTWEDILGDLVGLADQFVCATCMNRIFRGSTGHWGQRITLNKKEISGGIRTEEGKAVTFQCQDCVGKEPILVPQVHPNGQIVNHVRIAELPDHEPDGKDEREFGDYDDRAEQLAISQKQGLPDDVAQRIANSIERTQDRTLNEQDVQEHIGENNENSKDRQSESSGINKTEDSSQTGKDTQDKEE